MNDYLSHFLKPLVLEIKTICQKVIKEQHNYNPTEYETITN